MAVGGVRCDSVGTRISAEQPTRTKVPTLNTLARSFCVSFPTRKRGWGLRGLMVGTPKRVRLTLHLDTDEGITN